jgi:hypothetical protein
MAVLMIDQMHGKHEENIALTAWMKTRLGAVLNHVMVQLAGIIERDLIAHAALIIVIGILMFDQMDVHFDCTVEIRSTQITEMNTHWRCTTRDRYTIDEKTAALGRRMLIDMFD